MNPTIMLLFRSERGSASVPRGDSDAFKTTLEETSNGQHKVCVKGWLFLPGDMTSEKSKGWIAGAEAEEEVPASIRRVV